MKKISTPWWLPLIASAPLTFIATGLMAQSNKSLVGLSGDWNEQFRAISNIAGMIAFVGGFLIGINGILKLRTSVANPNGQDKVSTGLFMILIGALLIAVPTILGIGVTSLFGNEDGGTTNLDADGGGFRSLDQ